MEAARIAHETIGRLLGGPGAGAADVVGLAAERSRRGGWRRLRRKRPAKGIVTFPAAPVTGAAPTVTTP